MAKLISLLFFSIFFCLVGTGQPVYNDGQIQYSISFAGAQNETYAAYFKDAIMKLYIKGMQTRVELKTSLGNTVTIQDQQTGNTVILNEYGDQKIMVKMTPEQYSQANKKFENPTIEYLNNVKEINGYQCSLAKVKFSDGKIFSIFYTNDLNFHSKYFGIPVVLNGVPLEYEAEIGGVKVIYRAQQISTSPVAAGLFDTPSSGYREMKVEELPKN